jgi:hypothetical protein
VTNGERIHVLIPIFNDWSVVLLLLPQIDRVMNEHGLSADLVLIDDGSTVRPGALDCPPFTAIASVGILELRRNLGHQRAIAVGLTYLHQHLDPRAVVVMDGDGEDDPNDIPRLVTRLRAEGYRKIVFAERKRRSEPLMFRFFYQMYRLLHVLLTGYRVRVGNFSVIPGVALSRLVVISEMWNHYAAAVYNARIDYVTVPTTRAKRLGGQSHMSFISLVVHGLSALSVYGHIIGVRLLVVTSAFIGLTGLGLVALFALTISNVTALPTWLPQVAALVLVLLFQGITTAVVFVFIMLSGRQGASVIPLRDYGHFVQGFVPVVPRR